MESNNNTSKVALIVLAVLSAVLGVLYFRSNQLNTEQAVSIEEKATELANTRTIGQQNRRNQSIRRTSSRP
jgi:hypothetical protein